MIIVRADAFKKGESNGLPNMYVDFYYLGIHAFLFKLG